ncbi:MAG: M1 family peptidase [Zoogloeaceae bacterium]|nr:M1 family peptidase [Zoogloeaceae bacterium]
MNLVAPSLTGWMAFWVGLCLCLTASAFAQSVSSNHATERLPVETALAILIDPASRQLAGEASIKLHDGSPAELLLNADFRVTRLELDGSRLDVRPRRKGRLNRWLLPPGKGGRTVTVIWNGMLSPTPTRQQHSETLGDRNPTAGPDGGFLPAGSFWYPLIAQHDRLALHSWRVRVELPAPQRAVLAGTLASERVTADRTIAEFDFPHPGEGIDLMFGPYKVMQATMQSRDGRKLDLRTYFHAELGELANDYLSSVRDYIALYEARIGPYPFTEFSVVSSPTPTGFGMPALTYLGREVLKLPFIRGTSLGHEVLHNWWGNGVYPDYAQGNWSEGLTTFMADYEYALRDNPDAARAMRLGWLRELSAIPAEQVRPLADFNARMHAVSQAVGYGKAAMLFVMLEDYIGKPAFERALQRLWQESRFRVAGWDTLRGAFEAESGLSLIAFFDQWLKRPDLPTLRLERAELIEGGVRVTLAQSEPPFLLEVPLRIEGSGGAVSQVLTLSRAQQSFELAVDGRPARVVLDPESRLLRRLGALEAPPIMREIQLDTATRTLVLGDDAYQATAGPLVQRLLKQQPREISPGEAPDASPLLLIGATAEIDVWLAEHELQPTPAEVAGRGELRMWTTRFANGKPITLIAASSPEALSGALRPLPHYGQQSWLVIENARVVDRGVWPADAPGLELRSD